MITREKARALRALIEKAAASLPDEDALDSVELFKHWQPGQKYYKNDRMCYNGVLYKALKAHTSQSDYTPDITASLYTEVALPDAGTIDNPIPYNNNMALEAGKYYTQYDIKYLCTRDTVNPVYNDLADLVGLYVEVV